MGMFGKRKILLLVPILGLMLWFGLLNPGRHDAPKASEPGPKKVLRAVSLGPNITETIFEQMRDQIGIPVVTVFYDGMDDNTILSTFLHEITARKRKLNSATRY